MEIVLVPGLWLNASTWDKVAPHLEAAGHRVTALTLPGMESKDADRRGITLADHVAAVVEAIDRADGPVLLVGHSAGAGIAHMALDARPDRVARVVQIGGFPSADGEPLLSGLPAENGEVPMPDWAKMGEEANIVDFEPDQLAAFYDAAIPVPEAVVTTPVTLKDPRRHEVSITHICPEYTSADIRGWLESGDGPSELAASREVEYVDLPGGHWPQLTQPEALARLILQAAEASAATPA